MRINILFVPESSQVICVPHGGVEASGEGHINVEAHSWPTAHLQREQNETGQLFETTFRQTA